MQTYLCHHPIWLNAVSGSAFADLLMSSPNLECRKWVCICRPTYVITQFGISPVPSIRRLDGTSVQPSDKQEQRSNFPHHTFFFLPFAPSRRTFFRGNACSLIIITLVFLCALPLHPQSSLHYKPLSSIDIINLDVIY